MGQRGVPNSSRIVYLQMQGDRRAADGLRGARLAAHVFGKVVCEIKGAAEDSHVHMQELVAVRSAVTHDFACAKCLGVEMDCGFRVAHDEVGEKSVWSSHSVASLGGMPGSIRVPVDESVKRIIVPTANAADPPDPKKRPAALESAEQKFLRAQLFDCVA